MMCYLDNYVDGYLLEKQIKNTWIYFFIYFCETAICDFILYLYNFLKISLYNILTNLKKIEAPE